MRCSANSTVAACARAQGVAQGFSLPRHPDFNRRSEKRKRGRTDRRRAAHKRTDDRRPDPRREPLEAQEPQGPLLGPRVEHRRRVPCASRGRSRRSAALREDPRREEVVHGARRVAVPVRRDAVGVDPAKHARDRQPRLVCPALARCGFHPRRPRPRVERRRVAREVPRPRRGARPRARLKVGRLEPSLDNVERVRHDGAQGAGEASREEDAEDFGLGEGGRGGYGCGRGGGIGACGGCW